MKRSVLLAIVIGLCAAIACSNSIQSYNKYVGDDYQSFSDAFNTAYAKLNTLLASLSGDPQTATIVYDVNAMADAKTAFEDFQAEAQALKDRLDNVTPPDKCQSLHQSLLHLTDIGSQFAQVELDSMAVIAQGQIPTDQDVAQESDIVAQWNSARDDQSAAIDECK